MRLCIFIFVNINNEGVKSREGEMEQKLVTEII
jgi:hypothetical protein